MTLAGALRTVVAGAGIACLACGEDDGPPPTITLPPDTVPASPSPEPASPALPPIVDGMARTIRAVESGSEAEILERIVAASIPCASNAWPQPACAPGEPEGTKAPRLPFVGCEPLYLTADDLRVVIRQVIAGRMPSLFAAAEVTGPGSAGAFPLGPYALIFRTIPPLGVSADSAVLTVLNDRGEIISLRTGCRATPEELLQRLPDPQLIEAPRGMP